MLTQTQRSALVLRLRRGREDQQEVIGPRSGARTEFPLSYGQEQLWFIDQFAPGKPTYNVPLAIRLSGLLDATALTAALDGLLTRHEALRTRLVSGGQGRPSQLIDPPRPLPLPVSDLAGLEPGPQQDRLRQVIDAEAVRPFDLTTAPLLRARLLRLGGDEHILLIVVHHIVFDGWSAKVLVADLAALYGQEAGGEPAGLPALPLQFADYACWERDRFSGEALASLTDYWSGAMAGFSTLQFPTDHPRPVLDDFAGGLAQRMTDRGLLGALARVSTQQQTTLFVTLMAALHALLHRYTGQDDIIVGTVSANRARPELGQLIGFLVNTLPIRADLSGDPPFTQLLAQVQEAAVGAYQHQDLPFGKLVEALRVERDPSRAPIFQVALTYAERDDTPVTAAGIEFAITDLIVGINAAKFDLDFLAEVRSGGLWFECSYKTALFGRETVTRLLAHYEVLLRGIAANPAARLSQLPVLTPAELRQELTGWNDTAGPVPDGCVHQAFEAQAARSPAAIAAEFGDERVSYARLNAMANQLGRWLRGAGVGPEQLVGVCMATGVTRLAVLLGIWKAGGGYVPLDPAQPAGRLSFLLADAGLRVVVTDAASAGAVPAADGVRVLSADADRQLIGRLDDSNGDDAAGLRTAAGPGNVAYVIYTSGSTGQPKGVVVEHRQALNFLHAMTGHWRIGRDDVVLQFASLSFDASVQDTFMPLLAGARVVLAAPGTLHSPPRLAALMRARRVTFAVFTPSMLSTLGDERFPDLRVLMCGGEELPAELARRWTRPGLRFVNDYGPTETTVTAVFAELDASSPSPPPIGLPVRPNYQAYVLDPHLNPVPPGVTGELHIGGAGVARGYLNRPALTTQRFIPDPFIPGQRLYKTGDLVRRRRDGLIVFAGRADGQVKIRGLRIELGEIETAIGAYPGVAKAVVAVISGPGGEKQLAGYLQARPGGEPDLTVLRAHLARWLPGYMIPPHLISVAAFPLNSSGKIDRAALPQPGRAERGAGRVAPATPTEALLAGLYAAVLECGEVGADDSFFDLGGSSLAAMRLVAMISRQTGADIGVAAIFVHPTPRRLAADLDAIRTGTRQAAEPGGLTGLSSGLGTRPLVLIHAVGGSVFGYTPLARGLAADYLVQGLEAPGLSAGGHTPGSLDALVSAYTGQILAAQPCGPYRLGGWSMGGVVAFEVARRLQQAGAAVALLVLLDAPFALPAAGPMDEAQLAGRFLADATLDLGWDPAELPDPAASTAPQQLAWLAARLGGAGAGIGAQLRHRFEVFCAHLRMLSGYKPAGPPVAAPTLLVAAARSPNAPAPARWRAMLAGPVSVLRVDGDHYSFLRPPLVSEVAAAIRQQR